MAFTDVRDVDRIVHREVNADRRAHKTIVGKSGAVVVAAGIGELGEGSRWIPSGHINHKDTGVLTAGAVISSGPGAKEQEPLLRLDVHRIRSSSIDDSFFNLQYRRKRGGKSQTVVASLPEQDGVERIGDVNGEIAAGKDSGGVRRGAIVVEIPGYGDAAAAKTHCSHQHGAPAVHSLVLLWD